MFDKSNLLYANVDLAWQYDIYNNIELGESVEPKQRDSYYSYSIPVV